MGRAQRIEDAVTMLKAIIGRRDDGVRQVPLLRRLRAELASLQDDAALVAQIRAEMSRARPANAKVKRKAA